MPRSARTLLALVAWLAAAQVLPAQQAERPVPLRPRRPESRRDLDRREAVRLYSLALVCQHEDRLLEAVRHLERAARLDPDSAAVHKALVPLYLALERTADALAECRKVLKADPGDYETWFLYGRQLKADGRLKEARAAYARGVRCPGLKEHPDVLQQMHFELGVLYESTREYDLAVRAFTEAAKILEHPEALLEAGPFDPREITTRAAELYERIGRLAMLARKYDDAVAAFRKAQARSADRAGRLNYNLAEVCRAQGKDREALRYLDSYLRLQPQGTEAYELKIALLGRLGRQGDILAELERHVRADPYNLGLKLLLARQYEAAGRYERAEGVYQELARGQATPELYQGLFTLYKNAPRMGMGKALTLLDDTFTAAGKKDNDSDKSAAAARARAMLAVLRDDAALVKPLLDEAWRRDRAGVKLGYDTRHFLAVLAGRVGELDRAERFYRSCLDGLTPQNETAVYSGLLKALWQGRKYKEIVDVCRRGLRTAEATNKVLFHLDLARALPYLDRTDEAIAEADAAVKEAVPDLKLFTRLRRVGVLALAEKFDRAEAECKALLKEFPKPADVHDIRYALSNVYSAAHDYPKAERELERVIEATPDDAVAYNDLGYIWADQGKNLEKAEAHVRKAIELDRKQKKSGPAVATDQDKDNAAYVDSLGWVLFRRGRLEAARRELEKAVGLPDGADDPVVWDHLGDVCFRQDEPARARQAWAKAVTLYEVEKRRKIDQRYKEIKEKLTNLEPEPQP